MTDDEPTARQWSDALTTGCVTGQVDAMDTLLVDGKYFTTGLHVHIMMFILCCIHLKIYHVICVGMH